LRPERSTPSVVEVDGAGGVAGLSQLSCVAGVVYLTNPMTSEDRLPMASNKDVAERFLRAWAAGDTATARKLCHADLHFLGPIEEWHTADDHLAALAGVAQVVTAVDLHETWVDGDEVAVAYDLVTETPVGTARIAEWKTIKDGKIAEIRAYFDSHPWREAGFGG
jgi:ketosteroid isomerase-like protein